MILKKIELEDCNLYNGDCMKIMSQFPEKKYHAIIADLPYGRTKNKWDCVLDLDELWKHYKRILIENGVVILFGQIPFSIQIGASNLSWLKYEWIWEKDRPTGFLNSKKQTMRAHENILIFYNKQCTYNPQKTYNHKPMNKRGSNQTASNNYGKYLNLKCGGSTERYPRSVVKFNTVKPTQGLYHPTQKPIELLNSLVKTYTNEGDWILDNTMGSGQTGIASLINLRKFDGIEKDQYYFDISVKRCSELISEKLITS